MLENQQNKMQKKDTIKIVEVEEQVLESYFFPDAGVTIQARSLEEANSKLQEILNKK